MKVITLNALTLQAAVVFTLTSCSSTSEPPPLVGSASIAFSKGVPGGVLGQTLKTTATVTAIDHANRRATLQATDGKKFTVKVGPKAVNFDQIRVGDQVTATVTQKVVVSLDDEEAPSAEGAATVVAGSPKGEQPGGLVAETIQMKAKIAAVDLEKRTATLSFEDGTSETFPVRADVELTRDKVGKQIVFRVTEMIAIWVEKPR